MAKKSECALLRQVLCDWCGKKFNPPRPWSRFCHDTCKRGFQREALIVGSEVLRKRKRGGMHFGKVENSYPLSVLLVNLQSGLPYTTKELADETGLQNIATWVSALRKNGYIIDCRFVRTTANGSKVYEYTYRGEK